MTATGRDRVQLTFPVTAPTGDGPRATSVLVVGYRRVDLLAECLRSVREHLPGLPVRVWDNSGPDTPGLDELIAATPDVHWTRSDVNVGFAAAVNRLAAEAGDDDLLLLNPDARLLGPLAATLATVRSPGVAAAAPLVAPGAGETGREDWDAAHARPGLVRALVAHAGYAPRLRGTRFSDLYAGRPDEVHGYLTGACLAISREAWNAVGPFDEEFFLYGEEADWQARARAAGWRLHLVDEPGISHTGHGTVAGDPLAARRSRDLLRANVALALEHELGVHKADAYLAGTALLDRVQRSTRRERAAVRRRTGTQVVLTVNRLVFGGAERHHVVLASELQRRGYDVTIACMQRFGPLVREIGPQIRVVRQPWWSPLPDTVGARTVVVTGDTNTETGYGALLRRTRRHVRWLVAAHVPPVTGGPTYGAGLARAMRLADGFVALSQRHLDEVRTHHAIGRRHFLAPNGVSRLADLDHAPVRPAPDGTVRLVMLSRIVEHKNPHLLVEALAGLAGLPWRMAIYGDGPDRARLEALTPPELRDRVEWCGWVDGPDTALRDADLLCVPSGAEAFPLVILEAMARAVPVIASAVCAVPDMLDHGRAGHLVDPVDVTSWRTALRGVLADPQALPALGRTGFARMRANYTVEAMADAYEAAFDAVLTGR